jgi:hypothetical protein
LEHTLEHTLEIETPEARQGVIRSRRAALSRKVCSGFRSRQTLRVCAEIMLDQRTKRDDDSNLIAL